MIQLRLVLAFITLALTGCSFDETSYIQPKPRTIAPEEVTATSFVARWAQTNNANKYYLEVSTSPTFNTQTLITKTLSHPTDSDTIKGLNPNTNFYYRINIEIDGEISEYSPVEKTKTLDIAAPQALKPDIVTSQSFIAHWSEADGAETYRLTVALDSKFALKLPEYDDIKTTQLSVDIQGLKPEKKYYYVVRAISPNSESSFSNVENTTTSIADAIVAIKATGITKTSFTANWKGQESIKTYALDVSESEDFTTLLPDYDKREMSDTSFSVTKLTPNTKYYYRVRSKFGNYFSVHSNKVFVETHPLSIPVAESAIEIGLLSITAQWSSSEEFATFFYIDVATDENFINMLPAYNNQRVLGGSFKINNLKPGTKYYYRLRASGANALSDYSNTETGTTKELLPPSNFEYSDRKAFTFNTTWGINPLATSYIFTAAYDKNFTEVIEEYNEVEIYTPTVDIRVNTFNKVIYCRLQSKYNGFTSQPSETLIVTPAFSSTCRLAKITNKELVQKFEYDNLNRCVSVIKSYSDTVRIISKFLYEDNNTLPYQLNTEAYGNTYKRNITYTNNKIATITLYINNTFSNTESWLYDSKGLLKNQIVYSDINKTEQVKKFDFILDDSNRVVGMNLNGGFHSSYRYDDKLSPTAFIPYPGFLSLYTPLRQKSFFPLLNNVSLYKFGENIEEVFSFDYNDKNLATNGLGYYNWTVSFTKCDASK